jgi:hypothetical protein
LDEKPIGFFSPRSDSCDTVNLVLNHVHIGGKALLKPLRDRPIPAHL